MDDSWHIMTFSTSGGFVDNVVKIVIVFEEFPSREISVKDLTVHICMSTGMYVKCIKCMRNTTVKAAVNTQGWRHGFDPPPLFGQFGQWGGQNIA